MLNNIVKFFIVLIPSISGFLVLKRVFNSNQKILSIKTILSLAFLSLISLRFFDGYYNTMNPLLSCILFIIIFKIIFNKNIVQTVIGAFILMLLIFISEMLCFTIFINFTSPDFIRNSLLGMFIGNTLVGLLIVLISKIKILNNKISNFVEKCEISNPKLEIIFMLLIVFAMNIIIFESVKTFKFSFNFILILIVSIIFIILFYIYLNENIKYKNLNDQYSLLFEYVKNFEEYIDNEKLNKHEYKNQLASIKSMTNDQKVKKYIDKIIDFKINIEDNWIKELSNIPDGGLKGILYYKLLLAKKNKLNICISISKSLSKTIINSYINDLYILTQIIGIYFDNAIEEAINTKKKTISLEIYKLNNNLNIIISNSIHKVVNISDIKKKNYSTKGKNRGNGLYYASKLIKSDESLKSSSYIVGDYFYQKIQITKKG